MDDSVVTISNQTTASIQLVREGLLFLKDPVSSILKQQPINRPVGTPILKSLPHLILSYHAIQRSQHGYSKILS